MPGFDRTGPQGAGPRTGRGMGYCGTTTPAPGVGFGGGFGFGRGFGRGRGGMGFGRRNRFFATGVPGWVPPTPEQEVADLKAQAELMKGQLDAIQKRIEDLTSE
ncbi:MAG: DUF5320 domain-containing protein [Anaerolineae bacterium]|nr:DUF5320 domain-containing protein [Anaerolineae bacterium]